jgi:hypothetical protein
MARCVVVVAAALRLAAASAPDLDRGPKGTVDVRQRGCDLGLASSLLGSQLERRVLSRPEDLLVLTNLLGGLRPARRPRRVGPTTPGV